MSDKKERKLTQKQEKFILKYFECGNASEAYRHAYSTKRMSEKVIINEASLLLKNRDITVRLEELRAKAEEESTYTVAKVLKTYDEVIQIGLGKIPSKVMVTEGTGKGYTQSREEEICITNLPAVNTALTNIAKHLGMFDRTLKVEGEFNLKQILTEIEKEEDD